MAHTQRNLKMSLLIIGIFISSFAAFLLVGSYFMRNEAKEHAEQVGHLHQEVQELSVSIIEMENILESKDVGLDMKDELLQEKNVELNYLTVKMRKLAEAQQEKNEELEQVREQLAQAQVQLKEAYAQLDYQKQVDGLVYRVQIGAIPPDTNYTPPIMDSRAFEVEYAAGFHKYLMGSFRKYEASLNFQQMVQKMGIRDAWIIPYMDGRRLEGEDAKQYLPEPEKAPKRPKIHTAENHLTELARLVND